MIFSDTKINQFVTYLDVILIDLENDYILRLKLIRTQLETLRYSKYLYCIYAL